VAIPEVGDGRIKFTRRMILGALAALAGRLWTLQVGGFEAYSEASARQRLRLISTPGERGVIYDRNGELLVRNVPRFNVVAVRAYLPEDEIEWRRVIQKVASLLDLPAFVDDENGEESVEAILEAAGDMVPLLEPVVLRADVDKETALLIEQQQLNLPGIAVQVEPRREYLYESLLSHVIGYVGPVPAAAVDEYRERGYSPDEVVGLAGVEHTHEDVLRGSRGERVVEVDAAGRPTKLVGKPKEPRPGTSLELTLDVALQEAATKALEEGMARKDSPAGVVVALDPRDGAIRALVSLPSYDNNLFTRGITPEELEQLTSDPHFPLVNRAIAGLYPPGSTMKIVTASAGLEEQVIDPQTTRRCEGIMWVTSDDGTQRYPFYCFRRSGHGTLNVVEALRHSCDIFFYQVAGGFEDFRGLGQGRLAKYARSFGLGSLTGVDLPGELSGLIPDPKWKRLTKHQLWVTGDTYNCGIGQGDILVTPLQMACATMAVANDGVIYQPRVVERELDETGEEIARFKPRVLARAPVSSENLAVVREGMRQAVAVGTARSLGIDEVEVAGKTGTAEFFGPRDSEGNLPTHAWFVAFAPYNDPEIVVVVLIENSGEGAFYAVPVAAEVLRAYFGLSAGQGTR